MIIIPAIDIINGECVRLYKGDYATAHKVAENPIETALKFQKAGAELLHMVDLDGAKSGKLDNAETVIEVKKSVDMKIEIGGGIRSMESIEYYFKNGIDRVILGSSAIKNPELLKTAVREFKSKIVVGIDAADGYAKSEGWIEDSKIEYIELAKRMEAIGVTEIIYTDISTDGTLCGPNIEHLQTLKKAVLCNIVASGGVGSIDDIKSLNELDLFGVICGKALYTGDLDILEAIQASRSKLQEASFKKQEVRSKKQETRDEQLEVRGKIQDKV